MTKDEFPTLGSDAEDRSDQEIGFGWNPDTIGLPVERSVKRDHGYYWITINDDPVSRDGLLREYIAEWAYLGAAGEEVWFLPGDQDYRFDKEVTVRSKRLPEPSASIPSKLRDWIGFRDERRNYRLY